MTTIAKIPHSSRWRVTAFGYSVMVTAVKLRQRNIPSVYAAVA